LYATTYTITNTVESVAKAFTMELDRVIFSPITFISTCLVNVSLGVWKDIRFVQLYGRRIFSPQTNVPKVLGATFLFLGAITIFGSVIFPPILPPLLSDSYFANDAMEMAALQLSVPILSQIVASPVHLLTLDLYNIPMKDSSGTGTGILKRSLASTTVMRCSRIVPAFGVGLVANTGLRDYFHRIARATEPIRPLDDTGEDGNLSVF
ncbi:hypothetical protein EK21DRAFT_68423, partial [Setomelanomma holmii]